MGRRLRRKAELKLIRETERIMTEKPVLFVDGFPVAKPSPSLIVTPEEWADLVRDPAFTKKDK